MWAGLMRTIARPKRELGGGVDAQEQILALIRGFLPGWRDQDSMDMEMCMNSPLLLGSPALHVGLLMEQSLLETGSGYSLMGLSYSWHLA